MSRIITPGQNPRVPSAPRVLFRQGSGSRHGKSSLAILHAALKRCGDQCVIADARDISLHVQTSGEIREGVELPEGSGALALELPKHLALGVARPDQATHRILLVAVPVGVEDMLRQGLSMALLAAKEPQ